MQRKFKKNVHCTNMKKLIFAHLNVNSIRNKSDILSEQFEGFLGILMPSETKLDDSFSVG